jgi:carbamate kinase
VDIVTLGGNAILPGAGRGTFQAQMEAARPAMSGVADLIVAGREVVISHGNGPIVGNILIRNEAASDDIPPMPLFVCGADSQGGIGYMLQQILGNELRARDVERTIVSVVTQTVVDPADPAFSNPTKPIGPLYPEADAGRLAAERGFRLVTIPGRGCRRVVASPRPVEIVEWRAVRALQAGGCVVIVAGGGGVPVVREAGGALRGVEAVVDKDTAAAVLGAQLGAERLFVLTSVSRVALDYGLPSQQDLAEITLEEARRHSERGQFPPGSMGPKVEACVSFLESGGEEAVITSPQDLPAAAEGRAGTRFVRERRTEEDRVQA